jgi:hypothetical protein
MPDHGPLGDKGPVGRADALRSAFFPSGFGGIARGVHNETAVPRKRPLQSEAGARPGRRQLKGHDALARLGPRVERQIGRHSIR